MNEAYEYRVSVQSKGDFFAANTAPLIDLEQVEHQYQKACENPGFLGCSKVTLQRRLLVAPWETLKTLTV